MKRIEQPELFAVEPAWPRGFSYRDGFVGEAEERELLQQVPRLAFQNFQFQGFAGKRRVVSFGWRYDFKDRDLQKVETMPEFLLSLRDRAAAFAGVRSDDFGHALVTEYAPGAAIGWHRDKAVFEKVVGISLLSACDFRFRRKNAGGWERITIRAESRSAYLLSGPARTEWEHSIPEVERLRYSITFRNLIATAR